MSAGFRCVMTLAVSIVICGCDSDDSDPVDGAPVVYVDRETRQPVVLAGAGDMPAVNPQTGRRTLTPGLYCPQCQAWHATPPLEVLQRNPSARRCPKCRSALTPDGPPPSSNL